jgi:hypothetical protein
LITDHDLIYFENNNNPLHFYGNYIKDETSGLL